MSDKTIISCWLRITLERKLMDQISYTKTNYYWNQVSPTISGIYVMDGFGFPSNAAENRFNAECKVVEKLIKNQEVNKDHLLDLGCGIGLWAKYFAKRFSQVTGIETSPTLFREATNRCITEQNVNLVLEDVLLFKPEEKCSVIFIGGLLMYLNEREVVDLLRKVTPFLEEGGIILCRETTLHKDEIVKNDDYNVIYRSVQTYKCLFEHCGLNMIKVEHNFPYHLTQVACELMKKWKSILPKKMQAIPVVGRLVYWGVVLLTPWIKYKCTEDDFTFPVLRNNFFILKSKMQG